MQEVNHRWIKTNSFTLHIAEQGNGPLVILCHGFPECWYSWRHQLPALAEIGYHAVAPDLRGFGKSDCPEAIEAYNILEVTGDIVGLVHAMGEEQAVVAGNDWGAHVARYCALLRPDIFQAVILFSVPFVMRTWKESRPTEWMQQLAGDKNFYILYYQEPGKVEAELELDIRKTMRVFFASEMLPPEKRSRYFFSRAERFIDTFIEPEHLPEWLSDQDLDYYIQEYTRTGFRGGLNWYRNYDRNWELTGFLAGAKLQQPTLFIAGEQDRVLAMRREAFDVLEETVPALWKKVVLSNAGHWIQQERPAEVNQLLLEFLNAHQKIIRDT